MQELQRIYLSFELMQLILSLSLENLLILSREMPLEGVQMALEGQRVPLERQRVPLEGMHMPLERQRVPLEGVEMPSERQGVAVRWKWQ